MPNARADAYSRGICLHVCMSMLQTVRMAASLTICVGCNGCALLTDGVHVTLSNI